MLFKEYNLKIKLNSNFKIPRDMGFYKIERRSPEEILDQSFIDEFLLKNVSIREVQLFIAPPNYKGTIHVDGHNVNQSIGALNYIVTDNCQWNMEWFDADPEIITKSVSSGKTNYMSFQENECKKIDETIFLNPCIVQVGIPHRVNNYADNSRVCISIRFNENNFEELIKKFDEHFTAV